MEEEEELMKKVDKEFDAVINQQRGKIIKIIIR